MAVSRPTACKWNDGLLTADCEKKPLIDVLDQIARITNITIYLFETSGTETVQRSFVEEPLRDVLRQLLKGCNHAVIYNPERPCRAGGCFVATPTGAEFPAYETQMDRLDTDMGQRASNPYPKVRKLTGAMTQRPEREWIRTLSNDEGEKARGRGERQRSASMSQRLVTGWDSRSISSDLLEIPAGASSSVASSFKTEHTEGRTASKTPGSIQTPRSGRSDFVSKDWEKKAESGIPFKVTGEHQETSSRMSGEGTLSPVADVPAPQDVLRYQIRQLEARIASGESDREYDYWSGIRGEGFVIHDSVRLQHYQKKLGAMMYR